MRIDLDAERAARLEGAGDDHEVVLFGTAYTVPPEAPWEFARQMAVGRTADAFVAALGKEAWEEILAHPRLSNKDITALADRLCDVWGFGDEGESEASGGSSDDGGDRSKPTSTATTSST